MTSGLPVALLALLNVLVFIDTARADPPELGWRKVIVTTTDVQTGQRLSPDCVALENWPEDVVPEGAFSSFDEIEGRIAKTPLLTGEPVLERKLLAPGGWPGSIGIPRAYRVFCVELAAPAVPPLCVARDRVDVLLVTPPRSTPDVQPAATHILLQDIEVIAIGNIPDPNFHDASAQPATRATTVALMLTPHQAEKLALACELGKLRLVLRSPEDHEQVDSPGLTAADLLGDAPPDNPPQEGNDPVPDEQRINDPFQLEDASDAARQ